MVVVVVVDIRALRAGDESNTSRKASTPSAFPKRSLRRCTWNMIEVENGVMMSHESTCCRFVA